MKFFFAFATALLSHQVLFAAAQCQCNSNDDVCIRKCAVNMASCVQECTTKEMEVCTNECLSKHWPVTEKNEPMRAPIALAKRDEVPAEGDMGVSLAGAEASLSSHHGEGREGREGREGEGRGGHGGFGSHNGEEGHGSHDSKKEGPEPGFIGESHPPPLVPEPPREEIHHENEMHGDFKGREGFQHHNMAASTNIFTVGTTATMALTVVGAFLVAA